MDEVEGYHITVYRSTIVQHTIQYGSPRKAVKDTEVR